MSAVRRKGTVELRIVIGPFYLIIGVTYRVFSSTKQVPVFRSFSVLTLGPEGHGVAY